jgi:hypothetical protein
MSHQLPAQLKFKTFFETCFIVGHIFYSGEWSIYSREKSVLCCVEYSVVVVYSVGQVFCLALSITESEAWKSRTIITIIIIGGTGSLNLGL